MDIIEALNQNNANQLLLVSSKDLNAFADYLLSKAEKARADKNNEEYLSSNGVKDLLKIKNTSLFKYEKEGLLTPYKLGGLKKYKKSDINKLIEAGKL